MARKSTGNGKRNGKQEALPMDCTAGYIRVSTDKQAEEGYSLAAQTERIKAFCVAQGWQLCETYVDAVSGKSTARPQYQRMMQAAQAGTIRRVVAVKLDRIARNTRDFLATVDALGRAGCSLALIKENFDTSTPTGKFALTMLAAVAELEGATILERTMTGRVQKAAQGGFNGSLPPYGYDYNGAAFVVNQDQAAVVAAVFRDYLAGMSINGIARALNANGTPTAKGGKWYPSTVSYILHNGFYAGLVQYDGAEVQGTHETVISVDDYERAQTMLEAANRRHDR